MYTSETRGDDLKGDGSSENPLKSVIEAMRRLKIEPFPTIYVDAKEDKKVKNIFF